MIESTCPRCGVVHFAPVPVTQFACCPANSPVISDSSLKQVIRRTASRSFVENRADRPGDWVGKLIKHHFGIDPPKGCRCREVQNEMNRLGWAKCLEEIDRLAGRLKNNAKEFAWDVTIVAAIRAVATGAMSWLDPFDPWRSLIREACRRAKEDCQTADIGRADWWGAET
jgi:hypothetical protein